MVGYLKSKKFTDEMIGKMVTRHSMFLIMEVGQVDSKLGMFQKMFGLKGQCPVTPPNIVRFSCQYMFIMTMKFSLKVALWQVLNIT